MFVFLLFSLRSKVSDKNILQIVENIHKNLNFFLLLKIYRNNTKLHLHRQANRKINK